MPIHWLSLLLFGPAVITDSATMMLPRVPRVAYTLLFRGWVMHEQGLYLLSAW